MRQRCVGTYPLSPRTPLLLHVESTPLACCPLQMCTRKPTYSFGGDSVQQRHDLKCASQKHSSKAIEPRTHTPFSCHCNTPIAAPSCYSRRHTVHHQTNNHDYLPRGWMRVSWMILTSSTINRPS